MSTLIKNLCDSVYNKNAEEAEFYMSGYRIYVEILEVLAASSFLFWILCGPVYGCLCLQQCLCYQVVCVFTHQRIQHPRSEERVSVGMIKIGDLFHSLRSTLVRAR